MEIASTLDIAVTSREFVHIPVTATADGEPITLLSPPKIAFVAGTSDPETADWHVAEWHEGTARLLIGPGSSVALTVGTYWAWATWTAGLEVPVYRAGRIRVY